MKHWRFLRILRRFRRARLSAAPFTESHQTSYILLSLLFLSHAKINKTLEFYHEFWLSVCKRFAPDNVTFFSFLWQNSLFCIPPGHRASSIKIEVWHRFRLEFQVRCLEGIFLCFWVVLLKPSCFTVCAVCSSTKHTVFIDVLLWVFYNVSRPVLQTRSVFQRHFIHIWMFISCRMQFCSLTPYFTITYAWQTSRHTYFTMYFASPYAMHTCFLDVIDVS